jgi:hypothetical protein
MDLLLARHLEVSTMARVAAAMGYQLVIALKPGDEPGMHVTTTGYALVRSNTTYLLGRL